LDNTLSGVPTNLGFDVENKMYTPSWCVDRDGESLALGVQVPVYLFSSLALPPSATYPLVYAPHVLSWNKINYILNNVLPGATTADIQQAIWEFCELPQNPDQPRSALSNQMVNSANTPAGAAFVPGPGQVVAIICHPQPADPDHVQDSIIELTVPPTTGGPGLTPGFWKNNLAVYLGLANGNRGYSDPTGSPTVTKDTMGAFFTSLDDTKGGPYDLMQLYRNLSPQLDGITPDIRNAAANIFNVAAGLSPGPPWN
jgi:hypothetical protein